MIPTRSLQHKFRRLMVILGPIVVTQVALVMMNFVDTMMAGRFSAVDLAGVAIGANLWVPVFLGLSGILVALTPIVAQLEGAQRRKEVGTAVFQGVYVALLLSLLLIVAGTFSLQPVLMRMALEPDVHRVAHDYLVGLSWGIPPLFVYTVLRSFIDALGQTRVSMLITVASLPLNVFFNYVLIFGKWGFPRLGGVGAGYATAITYGLIGIFALAVVARVRPFSSYQVFERLRPVDVAAWREQLRIGLPIGFSIFVEVSIWSAVTLLMSQFGTVVIAANQAAFNFSEMLYMFPLSISMALTIAVGFEVGAKRLRDAAEYIRIGIGTSLAAALVSALILLLFRDAVAALYTTDTDVLQLISAFLLYAIFFQLSDAVAAPIQGSLRGYKDVNVAFMLSIVSHWVIALPLGLVLARSTPLGPFGYWIGLITGLACGAAGLAWRLRRVQRQAEAVVPAPAVAEETS